MEMLVTNMFISGRESPPSKISQQLEFINEKNWERVILFLDGNQTKRWEKKEFLNALCSDKAMLKTLSEDIGEDGKAQELFLKIAEYGGKRFVVGRKNRSQRNLIQIACRYNASISVISKLVAIGGRAAVVEESAYGWNSLHVACRFDASIDVVLKLIEAGGRDLVLKKDSQNWNALHYACRYNTCIDVVRKLVDVGGKKLVTAKAQGGVNALHLIGFQDASIDVIMKLVEVGGEDLVRDKTEDGWSSLHIACGCNAPIDILITLLEFGGSELLMQADKYGKLPLHIAITERFSPSEQNEIIKVVAKLISWGLQYQVGGEFGIGGLFNSSSNEVQDVIYDKWEDLVLPAMELVKEDVGVDDYPILQAAIINKAPPSIIKGIVEQLGCVATKDTLGRFPIDVAVEFGREWSSGTKEIAEAFALAQRCTLLHTCAKHGLQWDDGLRCAVDEGGMKDVEERDLETGMFPFMLAALAGTTGSTFQLIQMSPNLLVSE